MKLVTFENTLETAVRFENEQENCLELVYSKEDQSVTLASYQKDDPDGTMQQTVLINAQ